jgi:multiple sugar transport system ATP-binding protein
MARVKLNEVVKNFGKDRVVHGISLDIPHNEFLVLVGPSGCGKSTTLRMIAGLETIDGGTIEIGERVVNDVAPKDRDIAMVFQNYALYPHMTVYDNMAFGLKLRGFPKPEIDQRVREAADILGIGELLERRPKALSGGQRQRVAMGRAIVRKPQVFLFDEPLSNLDAKLRVQMRTEIKKLHQKVATTAIYVTHDQVEAMTLADRIVVLNKGRIEQIGDPLTLYENPANKFVASFIGSPAMNFIPGRIVGEGDKLRFQVNERVAIGIPDSRKQRYAPMKGQDALLGIRPEHIFEGRTKSGTSDAEFEAPVSVIEPMGNETMVFFEVNGTEITARLDAHTPCKPGKSFWFTFDINRIHLVDPATDKVM